MQVAAQLDECSAAWSQQSAVAGCVAGSSEALGLCCSVAKLISGVHQYSQYVELQCSFALAVQ